jgi:hypothetical protein
LDNLKVARGCALRCCRRDKFISIGLDSTQGVGDILKRAVLWRKSL